LLRRHPGSTFAAFSALTLGIGATTAIFSIVSAALLRPLPVKQPSRIVEIFQAERNFPRDLVSMQDFLDWKHSQKSFAQLALYRPGLANLTGNGRPELIHTLECDASMLPLLGVTPAYGRNFSPEDDLPDHAQTALLSWDLWRNRFAGQNVLGRKVLLSGKAYVIIGVLPANLKVPAEAAIWTPIAFDLKTTENTRGYHYFFALARLMRGVSLAAANSELHALSHRLASEYPGRDKDVSANAIPFEEVIRGNVRTPLLILFGAVISVLLIACVNVAHLLLVKASMRRREISVRIAVGATRSRILRQLMIESLLLSSVSAISGLTLAAAGVHLARTLDHTPIYSLADVSIDWRVLLFATAIAAGTGVFFGCFPALHAWRTNVNASLKQASGRVTESRTQQKVRKAFVFAQVALATVLLVCSVLFIRSLAKAAEVKSGFQTNSVLTMNISLSGSKYNDSQAVGRVADQILQRVHAVPGVQSAAFTRDVPLLSQPVGELMIIQGSTIPRDGSDPPPALPVVVSRSYFGTLRIPLISGRVFDELDSRPEVSSVIVNEALAKTYFGATTPLHRRVSFATDPLSWKEIVGVVADVRQAGLETAIGPQIYLPLAHLPMARLPIVPLCLVVRTAAAPVSFANALQQQVHEIDPDAPVVSVRTMNEVIAQQLGWRALQTWLLTAFSLLALLLTSLGIYAVIAFSVSQRINEIGTRMALGANENDMLRMMLAQGTLPAAYGALAGIAGAAVCAKLLASLLFGITAIDGATYLLVLVTQIVIAAAAAYLPAKRGARVDPWKALRHE
jgi:putative ABC transport system permease protein